MSFEILPPKECERAGFEENQVLRRAFIGGISAALTSAMVLGSRSWVSEASASTVPPGFHGTNAVDIAYAPWRVTNLAGTVVRVAPRDDATPVLNKHGDVARLPFNAVFGRQSMRNGRCTNHPNSRPSVNGYIWGFGMVNPSDSQPEATSKRQGWAKVADMAGYPGYAFNICGPDDADFDSRGRWHHGRNGPCPSAACGGNPAPSVTLSGVCWTISSRWYNGKIAGFEDRVYLRWAPNSTTIFWLMA